MQQSIKRHTPRFAGARYDEYATLSSMRNLPRRAHSHDPGQAIIRRPDPAASAVTHKAVSYPILSVQLARRQVAGCKKLFSLYFYPASLTGLASPELSQQCP